MSERIFIGQDAAHGLLDNLKDCVSYIKSLNKTRVGDQQPRIVRAETAIVKAESNAPSCSDCGLDMVRNPEHTECYLCPNCGAKSGQS